MQVRTQDAIAFYKHKLKQYEERRTTLDKLYEIATQKYEDKFFNKLFNWKYKDSFAGDKSWLSGNWEFCEVDSYINSAKHYLVAYTYQEKCKMFFVELQSHENQFYNWANENNIPY